MAVQNPPIALQAGSHPADRYRQSVRWRMGNRGGVIQGGLAVSQNGVPNLSVNVAEGVCMVPGTENSYQGAYFVENQGTLNLAISAADPTNPRRDLIIVRVRDAVYSGASNTASIEVVTGSPAASPSDPALPAGSCWVLARVAVAASAASITNANITDFRTGGTGYTGQNGAASALGGVIACTSALRPLSPVEGQVIYETDTDQVTVYNGSAWVPVHSAAAALVATSQTTASGAFVDLATVGPAVSILTGSKAIVWVHARVDNGSAGGWSLMTAAVSGATTVAASDIGFGYQSPSGGNFFKGAAMILFTGLNPGVNVFTAKYSAGVGTATFVDRRIAAMSCM